MVAKYARLHVRQTSADVRQKAQTLPDILSSRVLYTWNVDKENKNDKWYLPVINWEKCLTAAENVRQSAEGLPDILSGTPKINFAITESTKTPDYRRVGGLTWETDETGTPRYPSGTAGVERIRNLPESCGSRNSPGWRNAPLALGLAAVSVTFPALVFVTPMVSHGSCPRLPYCLQIQSISQS